MPNNMQLILDAALNDDPNALRTLLSQGVDINELSEDCSQTALHRVVLNHNARATEKLLSFGANVNLRLDMKRLDAPLNFDLLDPVY